MRLRKCQNRRVNKRDNPYTPGAGRKPPSLAGRDGDLEGFQALVERLGTGAYERSLIYSGLRGVGKTVLLMEFDVLATRPAGRRPTCRRSARSPTSASRSPASPRACCARRAASTGSESASTAPSAS